MYFHLHVPRNSKEWTFYSVKILKYVPSLQKGPDTVAIYKSRETRL